MHASIQLNLNSLTAEGSEINGVSDVFPDWSASERLGVVVHEPYGAIGASLLFQAFMATFYASNPGAADDEAQYPPAFMFHVGGTYGDFSSLDFWPARRQVFLANDAYEVLGAIRDRGVTRLLVPDAASHDLKYIREAPSGWTDLHATRIQTLSVYGYSPTGKLSNPDLTLTPLDSSFGDMVDVALDVEGTVEDFEKMSDSDLLGLELGPSTAADFRGWLRYFKQRAHEVPREQRANLMAAKIPHHPQDFRRLSVEEGLRRLAM